jgi:hypothetical protein
MEGMINKMLPTMKEARVINQGNCNMNIAQAYEWVKSFKISSIKNIGLLQTMTIRKLKAIASKMNSELGIVISKAMFGKTYANMNKQELINAIWFVRSIQLASPKGNGFEIKQLAERIFSMVADPRTEDETVICHYFAFNKTHDGTAMQNATRFYNALLAKSSCQLASIREADRLAQFGAEVEVKVWGINPQILIMLLNKTIATPQVKTSQLKPVSFNAGSRFVVAEDGRGWFGNTGEVVRVEGDKVWAIMDSSPIGKVDFKVSQLKLETEVDIESWIKICQQMYNNVRDKSDVVKNAIVRFISNRGLQVVNDVVDVRF